MIPEFIDFCAELFPCINPYTREQAKKAMTQFEKTSVPALAKTSDSSSILEQGDIFSEIPFLYYDKDGAVKTIKRKAQLLSNTCDASRSDKLLFAALHPLKDIESNRSLMDGIVRNKKFSAFYLPDELLEHEYVDFELVNSIPRDVFHTLYDMQKVKRIATLTLVGYYMFICKMTVFYLRPEDSDVQASR